MSQKGALLLAQSGGPTAVVNSSLYGAISEARKNPNSITRVLGAGNGVLGLLQGDVFDLTDIDQGLLDRVRRSPGAALGSCRFMLKDEPESRKHADLIFEALERFQVRFLLYIGGNDSMDTAAKIHRMSQERGYPLSVIGIPKTVDNDLAVTDHSPGYGSAAKYVIASVLEAGIHAASISSAERVYILETVGRNTGWLAASAALAKRRMPGLPLLIYLPETPFRFDKLYRDVNSHISRFGGAFIVIGEGLRTPDGSFVGSINEGFDPFGHPQLGDAARRLAESISRELGLWTRYVKLDVCQQSGMHFASETDWREAHAVGEHAVRIALDGMNGKMVTLLRNHGSPYSCRTGATSLEEVANREKMVPAEWILEDEASVTDELCQYVLPLLMGEVRIDITDGIPGYASLNLHQSGPGADHVGERGETTWSRKENP